MKPAQFAKRFVFVFLVGISMSALTACGSSQYIDALNKNLSALNSAIPPINQQINKLNQDNTLLGDKTWQDETSVAVDNLDTAGKAFANLPTAPDNMKDVDALVKELAFEINSFSDAYRTMITNQDLNQLDTANSHMTKINDLMTRMNAAIDAANK